MDESNSDQITPSNSPDQQTTDANTAPVATDNSPADGASNDTDTITLKQSDYKNLVAQRDRANASNGFVEMLAQERLIDEFLKENADKYPDLTREDLLSVSDPDALESEATRLTRRFEEQTQKKLLDLTRADAPQMSPDERSAELKKLADNPGGDSFDRMLELRLPSNK